MDNIKYEQRFSAIPQFTGKEDIRQFVNQNRPMTVERTRSDLIRQDRRIFEHHQYINQISSELERTQTRSKNYRKVDWESFYVFKRYLDNVVRSERDIIREMLKKNKSRFEWFYKRKFKEKIMEDQILHLFKLNADPEKLIYWHPAEIIDVWDISDYKFYSYCFLFLLKQEQLPFDDDMSLDRREGSHFELDEDYQACYNDFANEVREQIAREPNFEELAIAFAETTCSRIIKQSQRKEAKDIILVEGFPSEEDIQSQQLDFLTQFSK